MATAEMNNMGGGGVSTTDIMSVRFEGSSYAPQFVAICTKGYSTLDIRHHYDSSDRILTIYTANGLNEFIKANETLLGTCNSTTFVSIDISNHDYIYIVRESTAAGATLNWWYKLIV